MRTHACFAAIPSFAVGLFLLTAFAAVAESEVPWGIGPTPAQRRFLSASRAERARIIGDAEARAELAKGTAQEIDGVFNFRDLGGKRGLDGRLVRPRRLYRSARFDQVTGVGRRELTDGFGIRFDLDLRTPKEVAMLGGRSPLGTNVTWKLVPFESYAGAGSVRGRKAMRTALKTVFSPGNWPLAFHCKTGKDRTGTLAFVLLSLLGVDEETICLDWERTAFHVPELSRMDHPPRYDRMLDYFMSLPGTNLTAKTEGYVRSLGFSAAEIDAFRDAFGRVSPAVTSAFERVVAKGLPIVLVCHVPLPAEQLLKNRRVCRYLTGEGEAKGDAATAAFVARVRGEPLVRAILSGHLHGFDCVRFSPTAEICVANALFNGEAVEVTFAP